MRFRVTEVRGAGESVFVVTDSADCCRMVAQFGRACYGVVSSGGREAAEQEAARLEAEYEDE